MSQPGLRIVSISGGHWGQISSFFFILIPPSSFRNPLDNDCIPKDVLVDPGFFPILSPGITAIINKIA
jgi:hypothetical protein